MSVQANPKVVGSFVVGAIGLIVASILIFSSGNLLEEKTKNVTYFPGTVQGLAVGAPVMFRGVEVGQVTRISLDFWPHEQKFLIPVYYEIWRDQLRVRGADGEQDEIMKANFQEVVDKAGLRAKLEVSSFVTGQYFISLDLLPDTEVKLIGASKSAREIPAVESTRDELASVFKEIDFKELAQNINETVEAVKNLVEDPALTAVIKNVNTAVVDFDRLMVFANNDIGPLANELEETLRSYKALAVTTEEKITTLSKTGNRTLKDISGLVNVSTVTIRDLAKDLEKTSASIRGAADEIKVATGLAVKDVNGIIGDDSSFKYKMDTLVDELTGAARSLRALADYIETKPEALIFGK